MCSEMKKWRCPTEQSKCHKYHKLSERFRISAIFTVVTEKGAAFFFWNKNNAQKKGTIHQESLQLNPEPSRPATGGG